MFGADVQFNIGGQSKITSIPGLLLTILSMAVMFAYAQMRLQILIYQLNPNITQAALNAYYDSTYQLKFSDIGYKVAWAVESYTTPPVGKDDPSYVHWQVQLTS